MVQYGQADAIVGGNQAMPAAYFRALLHTIKPLPNVPKIFGVTILTGSHLKNLGGSGILLLADCGADPESRRQRTRRHRLGNRQTRPPFPRPQSRSSPCSATRPKAAPARRTPAAWPPPPRSPRPRCCKQFLDIDIEGELQADVALDPEAAEIKLPAAEARPTADVLVFPNLDAAHISLKLLQHVAGAQTYGQLILGLSRPAAQVPRTATVETIFGTAAAIAVEAIKFHQLYPDGEV